MILSKRERLIVGIVVVGAVVLAADFFGFRRMEESRRQAEEVDKPRLVAEMQRGASALTHQTELAATWKDIVDAGLKRDPAEAESQVLHALADWSRETGVKIVSMKPERAAEREKEKKSLQEITFVAAGTGSMSAVSRFVWRAETTKIPLRIKALQLGSRKEGTDDLTLELKLSTLYEPVRAATATAAATTVAASKTGGKE